jgi:hypothetical protein
MIKHINNQNFLTTPFVAIKRWELSNVDPKDVVLTDLTGSEESIALEFVDYTTGTPFVNRECNIALDHQPNDLAIPESGKSGSGTFFPTIEDTNQKTNTFKRLVYAQIQKAFYNNYKNPLKIFGIDNIDFPLSNTDRFIGDEFLMFTIPRNVFGERMSENTVIMYDRTFDDNVLIQDDGYGNLIAGLNLFSKIQEVRTFGNDIISGSIPDCISKEWNENSASWDSETLMWDECISGSLPECVGVEWDEVSGSWDEETLSWDGCVPQ